MMGSDAADHWPFGFSFVICTYQRPDLLEALLADLRTVLQEAREACEVVVVDNDNGNRTAAADVAQGSGVSPRRLHFVHEPKLGLSRARNRGVQESKYRWVVLLDDDTRLQSNRMVEDLSRVIRETGATIISPRIVCPVQPNWPKWLKCRLATGVGQYDFGAARQVINGRLKTPIGACVAFDRRVFLRYGPFPISLGYKGRILIAGEETVLLDRAMISGEPAVYEPAIEIEHPLEQARMTKRYWRRHAWYGGATTFRVAMLVQHTNYRWFSLREVAAGLYHGLKTIIRPRLGMHTAFCRERDVLFHLGRSAAAARQFVKPVPRSQEQDSEADSGRCKAF